MTQLPPTQARETLGVMRAPLGDETEEYKDLESKIKNGCRESGILPFKDKMRQEMFPLPL